MPKLSSTSLQNLVSQPAAQPELVVPSRTAFKEALEVAEQSGISDNSQLDAVVCILDGFIQGMGEKEIFNGAGQWLTAVYDTAQGTWTVDGKTNADGLQIKVEGNGITIKGKDQPHEEQISWEKVAEKLSGDITGVTKSPNDTTRAATVATLWNFHAIVRRSEALSTLFPGYNPQSLANNLGVESQGKFDTTQVPAASMDTNALAGSKMHKALSGPWYKGLPFTPSRIKGRWWLLGLNKFIPRSRDWVVNYDQGQGTTSAVETFTADLQNHLDSDTNVKELTEDGNAPASSLFLHNDLRTLTGTLATTVTDLHADTGSAHDAHSNHLTTAISATLRGSAHRKDMGVHEKLATATNPPFDIATVKNAHTTAKTAHEDGMKYPGDIDKWAAANEASYEAYRVTWEAYETQQANDETKATNVVSTITGTSDLTTAKTNVTALGGLNTEMTALTTAATDKVQFERDMQALERKYADQKTKSGEAKNKSQAMGGKFTAIATAQRALDGNPTDTTLQGDLANAYTAANTAYNEFITAAKAASDALA